VALDEPTVIGRARAFIAAAKLTAIPVRIEDYLASVQGVLEVDPELEPEEAGWSIPTKNKHVIGVNARDRLERQRFTVCHEIAHIVLKLPSNHTSSQWWSYSGRPLAEVLCDVFAAELLLPFDLFQPEAEKAVVSLATVEALADRFQASFSATGSRYASVITTPCAFVLSEEGKVRYASRSKVLLDARAWVNLRSDLPSGPLSERVRGGAGSGREEIAADLWFNDWERGGTLLEEARHMPQWDQTLTLLWFENEEVPPLQRRASDDRFEPAGRELREDEEEFGLEELDGNLRWPGRSRRR